MFNLKETILSLTAKIFSLFVFVHSQPILLYCVRILWLSWYGFLIYLIIYIEKWTNSILLYTITTYILPIAIVISSLMIVMLVLLQRNEDGIFQRSINNGGIDSTTMVNQTIKVGIHWVIQIMLLTKILIVSC